MPYLINELVGPGGDRRHAREQDSVVLIDLAFPLAGDVAFLEVLPGLHVRELSTDGCTSVNTGADVTQAPPVLFLFELVCARG